MRIERDIDTNGAFPGECRVVVVNMIGITLLGFFFFFFFFFIFTDFDQLEYGRAVTEKVVN